MRDDITIETNFFEHREVKSHFINPCCFGEDFAAWLRCRLSPLAAEGFHFADAIQEDYGWGFWASHRGDRFWIALSYAGDGPQEEPAQWVISVDYSAGLNLVRRLFRKSHQQAFTLLRDGIWRSLRSNPEIRVIEAQP
jgi:hypothetical protein